MGAARTDSELTPDLIDRVKKLSAEDRDTLVGLLDELDGPPDPVSDWPAEIRRRLAKVADGSARFMTKEESDAAIRDALRAEGFELP